MQSKIRHLISTLISTTCVDRGLSLKILDLEKIESMKVVLFDTPDIYRQLLPLSYTRPVAAFRVGIVTIREKWEHFLPGDYCYYPKDYLREKYPSDCEGQECLFIVGNKLPDAGCVSEALTLKPGGILRDEYGIWAFRGTKEKFDSLSGDEEGEMSKFPGRRIDHVFDIFLLNAREIESDFAWLTEKRKGIAPDKSTTIIGDPIDDEGRLRIFIEPGAIVESAVINLKNGPVYIGKNAQVMEGSMLRGPLAVCDNAKIKMSAKIYGSCTFGPFCKVGGEIDNSVIFGYSNKAHDGYLGNAVIGEWCNIGAGTNCSNLKNDYSKIRIWNYREKRFIRTDLQFCGVIMGDHSKVGINCMFNTATVVGVGVNFHGAGFPRQFIPSFLNGSPEAGYSDVSIDTFMTVAGRVMSRRDLELTDVDRRIFEKIYQAAVEFKTPGK